jgi:uncharacterized protein (DUF58 family)
MNLLTRELLSEVASLQIASRRRLRFAHKGEKNSLHKGSSAEFSDYREYLQGDDIRSIDWNVYARSERLYLKLFLEEQSKPIYSLVDASESMRFGNPSKLDYALATSAALSYAALRRYDRPEILVLQQAQIKRFHFSSQHHFFMMLPELEKIVCSGETLLNSALKKIAAARQRRGIIFLISDFYSSDGFEAIKLLASSGNELHCFHVLTAEEWDPQVRGELRMIDSENFAQAEVSISPQVIKKYRNRLNGFTEGIRKMAHQCGSSYHQLNTSTPLKEFLLQGLRQKGIVA